jgi:large subunit ribosomal protein L35
VPKIKTRRAAAKRFTVTASGKIRRKKAFASHILTKKTPKRKQDLRKGTLVDKSDHERIAKMLPYL